MRQGDVFIISAPSGSGKTTICRKLAERVENLELSISYTTRPRKPGEVDGRDYHFIDDEKFDKMKNRKDFLECAAVFGHRYGTSRDIVRSIVSRGVDAVLEIDVQGGRQVKAALPEAVLVAIFPPGISVLRRRLLGRGRDSREEMEARLRAAAREIRDLLTYDFLVVNDDLDAAVDRVEWIVRAHRLRRDRAKGALSDMLKEPGEGNDGAGNG
ncbi:MAG: guanylate kinase [Deltaproteobacteria bacterium]|nr:guanylate kinase [Deltaproteobacteria bacterium]